MVDLLKTEFWYSDTKQNLTSRIIIILSRNFFAKPLDHLETFYSTFYFFWHLLDAKSDFESVLMLLKWLLGCLYRLLEPVEQY